MAKNYQFFQAQLATLVSNPPRGDQWLHEMKFDGYRIIAVCHGPNVRLITRNGNDWTDEFSLVARDVAKLGLEAVLDGEVAVVLPDGTTSFEALQQFRSARDLSSLAYFVFDLLSENGQDLRSRPQVERKQRLEQLLAGAPDRIRYSQHVVGNGDDFFRHACEAGLEGIVSKRVNAPYRAGRSTEWLKVKCVRRQEFVIGGFTEPSSGGKGIGALLLGYYDAAGDLIWVGKAGTGFTVKSSGELRARLDPLEIDEPPFANPPTGREARDVHWVRPELVGEVGYTEITKEGILRHPSFKGLRLDRPASTVTLEEPVAAAAAKKITPKKKTATKRKTTTAKKGDKVEVGGILLSSPDRVAYPEDGITKLEVASYYEAVGEWLLPHFKDRPLTLVRCPDTYHQCFFQKHIDQNKVYEHITPIPIQEEKGVGYYGSVDTVDGVLSLVQLGALEFHTWCSRRDKLEQPDKFVLDIDPDPSVPWTRVVKSAHVIRDLLSELGLVSFAKTTGGKGLHVVVPIQRKREWDDVKAFTEAIATLLVQAAPREFTMTLSKAKRKGKILVDYLRNARGATAIEAYSTRARAGAPVSLPVHWDEVTPSLKPGHFNVRSVPKRLASLREDPWADFSRVRQSITSAMMKRVGLG